MTPIAPLDPFQAPLEAMPPMLAALFVLAMVIGLLGGMLWIARRALRLKTRLTCPARLQAATVVFSLGPDGEVDDVERCSLLRPYRSIICGKVCLGMAAAAKRG
jgi:hypothetical protein